MDIKKEDKVKVMRIIARLNIGGPAVHTILLTEGLNKENFNSLLVSGTVGSGEEDMAYLFKAKGVSPIFIPELKRDINFINDLAAFFKIFLLIKKERPQIIHTHTAKAGSLGRIAGILHNLTTVGNKAKIIHTFHGTVLQGYFGKLKTRIFILIERLLAFFTDRIIVLSDKLKKELLSFKIGDDEKLVVLPLGFEMDGLLTIPYADVDSVIRVGIVGRLVPIKNHRMFLEACSLILDSPKGRERDYKFLIIGDGELKKDLQAHVLKLGIEEDVEFLGWQEDIVTIYSSLDIVVLTSLNEGTPLSLIEAMAAGRPVVATDVGGVRDLFAAGRGCYVESRDRISIYRNGILCKVGNAQAMADAIRLLYDNPGLMRQMGESGREFVRQRFSKERLISDIELLYNNILKKRGL